MLFLDDGLGDSMRHDYKQSISLFLPVLACICTYYLMADLPSFH